MEVIAKNIEPHEMETTKKVLGKIVEAFSVDTNSLTYKFYRLVYEEISRNISDNPIK